MSTLATLGRAAWRLFVTEGVPSSGLQQPLKTDILAFVTELERRVDWVRRTDDFAPLPGGLNACDTTGGPIVATMPEEMAEGDRFDFSDFAGTWATNNLTIDPNGNEFEDVGDGSDPEEPMTCSDPVKFSIVFAAGKLRVRIS